MPTPAHPPAGLQRRFREATYEENGQSLVGNARWGPDYAVTLTPSLEARAVPVAVAAKHLANGRLLSLEQLLSEVEQSGTVAPAAVELVDA
jgi:hypothetical protein